MVKSIITQLPRSLLKNHETVFVPTEDGGATTPYHENIVRKLEQLGFWQLIIGERLVGNTDDIIFDEDFTIIPETIVDEAFTNRYRDFAVVSYTDASSVYELKNMTIEYKCLHIFPIELHGRYSSGPMQIDWIDLIKNDPNNISAEIFIDRILRVLRRKEEASKDYIV